LTNATAEAGDNDQLNWLIEKSGVNREERRNGARPNVQKGKGDEAFHHY